jgi:hypothetical protein
MPRVNRADARAKTVLAPEPPPTAAAAKPTLAPKVSPVFFQAKLDAPGWQTLTLTRPGLWQLKTRDPAVPAAQTLVRQLRDQLPPDAELRLEADLTLPVDEAQLIAP